MRVVKLRKRHESNGVAVPPAFLSPEAQRVWWQSFGVISLFDLIRSGIRPGPFDPKAWYDRALRVFGGTLVLLLLAGALIFLIRDGLLGAR